MTTELATIDGEVIEEQTYQPVTLYGTTDPVAIVERASTLATALSDVIRSKHLFKQISGRNHVLVEGWTLLGSMLGVFAEVEWTRPTDNGWEARAVARTLNGKIVGAAEAMCSRSERTWSGRDEYALRSMAQTRAVSKALRLPLGYIIELAGYSATPADEIPEHESPAAARPPAPRSVARARLASVASAHGITADKLEQYAEQVGASKPATDAQIEQIIALIEQPDGGVPTTPAGQQESTPSGDQGSVLATPPAATKPATASGQPDPSADAAVVVAQPETEAIPPASDPAAPSLDDILAATGGELVDDAPEHGTEAYREWFEKQPREKRQALRMAKLGPSDKPQPRTAPDPEPVSAGL